MNKNRQTYKNESKTKWTTINKNEQNRTKNNNNNKQQQKYKTKINKTNLKTTNSTKMITKHNNICKHKQK